MASVTLHVARESNSDHIGARLKTGLSKDAIVPMKVFLSIYKFAMLAHVLLGFLALGQRYVKQPDRNHRSLNKDSENRAQN